MANEGRKTIVDPFDGWEPVTPSREEPIDVGGEPVAPKPYQAPQFGYAKDPSLFEQFYQKLTGTGARSADYPDFASAYPGSIRSSFLPGLLLSNDPAMKSDIIAANVPGATFGTDQNWNPTVTVPDMPTAPTVETAIGKLPDPMAQGGTAPRTYYVDRPGVDPSDVRSTLGQGALYYGAISPLQRLGAAMYGKDSLGILGRAATTGAGAGVTSLGIDQAATLYGSKQSPSAERAFNAMAFGAGAELLQPVFNVLARGMAAASRRAEDWINPRDLTFTVEGERVLREAGINIDDLSMPVRARILHDLQRVRSPDDAAVLAQAETLPVPVTLTRGNVSLAPSDQMFESMAAKGAYGEGAMHSMRGVRDRQTEQLRGNVPAIQERLSGGPRLVGEMGEGGAQAQDQLVRGYERAQGATRAAYAAAEGQRALVSPERLVPLAGTVVRSIDDFTTTAAPAARELSRELARLTEGDQPRAVKELFDWRRRAATLRNTPPNASEGAAAGRLVRAFDDGVDDAVRAAIVSGDNNAAGLWLRAVAIRRGQGRRYEAEDLIATLVEEVSEGGRGMRLKVAPEAAANVIFGATDSKLLSQPQMARELQRLRARLGADSEGWRALKEEAWLRFSRRAEGAYEGPERGFSGVKLLKAWEDANARNGPVIRTLFNQQERDLIGQFARVSARVTGKVSGGDNSSGTAVAAANLIGKLAQATFLGPRGQALLGRFMGPIYDQVQQGRVNRAVAVPSPVLQAPPGIAGAMGAAIGAQ